LRKLEKIGLSSENSSVRVKISFWGYLKELMGKESIILDLDGEEVSIKEVISYLKSEYPSLKDHLDGLAFAVGDEIRGEEDKLQSGDDLVLLPPVSGG
jgi:molybdopterin converting factor small subunit